LKPASLGLLRQSNDALNRNIRLQRDSKLHGEPLAWREKYKDPRSGSVA
jgi:hypothetical protein